MEKGGNSDNGRVTFPETVITSCSDFQTYYTCSYHTVII